MTLARSLLGGVASADSSLGTAIVQPDEYCCADVDLLAAHLAIAAHRFLAAFEIFARVAADIARFTVFAIFLSVLIAPPDRA